MCWRGGRRVQAKTLHSVGWSRKQGFCRRVRYHSLAIGGVLSKETRILRPYQQMLHQNLLASICDLNSGRNGFCNITVYLIIAENITKELFKSSWSCQCSDFSSIEMIWLNWSWRLMLDFLQNSFIWLPSTSGQKSPVRDVIRCSVDTENAGLK